MLNTASVELTNSVESDLTWKTVRKGSRSSSRLRKPAMKPEVVQQQDDKSTKKEPASVSGSEKPGAAILGRRLADRIELVPIKKRRLMFQSTSTPPQNPSPNIGNAIPAQTQSQSQPQSSLPAQPSLPTQTQPSLPAQTQPPLPAQTQPSLSAQTQPSLPAQTQSSLPAQTRSKEDSASGQCSGLESVSRTSGPTAIQFSQGTEDRKNPQVANIKPEVSASGPCSSLDSASGCNGPTAVQFRQGTDGRKDPQATTIKPEISASGQCSGLGSVSGCDGPTAVQFSHGTEDRRNPLAAKIKTEYSTSGQCSGLGPVSQCNGPIAVQFGQGTEEGHLNGRIPQIANIKLETCSVIELLGDAACRSMDDDTVKAKGSPAMGKLSKPVATDPSQTASALEKVCPSEKAADPVQDASVHDGINYDSKVHIRCAGTSVKFHDERDRDGDALGAKGSIIVHNSRSVASDSSLTALTLENAATSQGTTNMVKEALAHNDSSINDPNVHTMQAGMSVKSQEKRDRDDNALDAKGSHDNLSRPVATDSSLTVPSLEKAAALEGTSLEKAATLEGTANIAHEALAHDADVEDSKIQMKCANESVKFHEERDADNGNVAASKKDVRFNWDLNTVMESWDLPSDDCVEGIPRIDKNSANLEKVDSHVQCEHAVDFSDHSSAVAEASTQVISMDNLTMGTAQFEIRSGMFLDPVASQKITPETNSVQSIDDSRQNFDAPDKGISRRESLTMGSFQMLDVDYPASKLGKPGSFQASPEHDNLSASGTTFEEGQPVVANGVEEGNKETPAPDAAQNDNSMQGKREQIPKSYDFLGEASVEDCDYGGYDSDVSQGAHGHTVGIKNRRDHQSGYESPFEDGELRELDALAREENEENEVGFETECVDYDLDDRDAEEFDAPIHHMSEIASEICQTDKGSLPEKPIDSATPLNESSYMSKDFSGDQLPDGPEDINRSVGAGDVALEENVAPEQADGLVIKSSSSAGEVGPRENRGKVFRHPEEPLYSGGAHRERNTYMQRSRYRYDSSFHSGKVFASGKPIRRHQDDSQGGRQWVGSCGNLRKLPPSGNEYPLDDEDPRPRSINANSVEKADGQSHRFQRRPVHNPSNNYRQPFVRRRSPSDRDDSYSTRGRVVEGRDGSNFRSRGRPGIYRQGVNRGPRDEYGPMCDSGPSSSVQQPHYNARRERSFSPALTRDNSFSHPRRRSRSRSRSPPMWHVQRDRSMGVSPPGRSIDFRADPRMERNRPTFRKTNFAADDDEFMASPPRTRFSPQSNSRWIDDRKCAPPNFRGRKMPGRFSTRNERFNAEGSPEPMKSDDCYRSTTRPGRFSEMSGGRGRGRRYDSSDNRMKYRDRYEFPQRPRHYDTSPVPRRFGCGTEECSENEGERVRDTDGRDAPLRSMEERGPPRYNKERMYG